MTVEPEPQHLPLGRTLGDGRLATPQEAHEAIVQLTDADVEKLVVAAKYFWKRRVKGARGWTQAEELLSEAIALTLEGTRNWPSSTVTIVKFLDRTMESISSHIAEKRSKEKFRLIKDSVDGVGSVDQGSHGQDPSKVVEARDEAAHVIEELFSDDPKALELLFYKRDGYSASEVQAESGITKTEYETGWRRIRRKVAKYTKNTEEA